MGKRDTEGRLNPFPCQSGEMKWSPPSWEPGVGSVAGLRRSQGNVSDKIFKRCQMVCSAPYAGWDGGAVSDSVSPNLYFLNWIVIKNLVYIIWQERKKTYIDQYFSLSFPLSHSLSLSILRPLSSLFLCLSLYIFSLSLSLSLSRSHSFSLSHMIILINMQKCQIYRIFFRISTPQRVLYSLWVFWNGD